MSDIRAARLADHVLQQPELIPAGEIDLAELAAKSLGDYPYRRKRGELLR